MSYSRRDFLVKGGLATLGTLFIAKNFNALPLDANVPVINPDIPYKSNPGEATKFHQAPLPYSYKALEPYIDAQTMEIHYSKHHAGYVNKLNAAIGDIDDFPSDLRTVFKKIKKYPDAIRNNGGGHWNHEFFWQTMRPGKNPNIPDGKIAIKINEKYGSFDNFKKMFADEAAAHFGSGWAWLTLSKDGDLNIMSTPNQDNPFMYKKGGTPLLGIDVWEHAYYLKYQNKRADYISGFFGLINWTKVNERLEELM